MAELVTRHPFDEGIFGVPYLRIPEPAAEGVEEAFRAALAGLAAAKADARAPARDRPTHARLVDLGFHRVCTQVTFEASPAAPVVDEAIARADRWPLSDDEIAAHARGFTASRFAQDVKTEPALAERWIAAWLRNSLTGRRQVVALGPDVVTFALPDDDGVLIIDLVSVLRRGRRHGRRLVAYLRGLATTLGARAVRVSTEAENVAAQRLYTGQGFALTAARACFHFTR